MPRKSKGEGDAPVAAGEDASKDAPEQGAASGPFGGMTASEAARRRWDAVRAGPAEPEDEDAAAIRALAVDERDVVTRLKRRIRETGDPQAARELRAWLDRAKEQAPEVLDPAAMARADRDRLLVWLAGADTYYSALLRRIPC